MDKLDYIEDTGTYRILIEIFGLLKIPAGAGTILLLNKIIDTLFLSVYFPTSINYFSKMKHEISAKCCSIIYKLKWNQPQFRTNNYSE